MSKPEPASAGISLFYSYSHMDERYRNKLETHLSNLKRQGLISEWHDRKITGGTEWKGQIEQQLEAARVILLLVSSDFIHSEFCYSVELKRALERHDSGEARVIPIIARPCDWKTAPFGKLQALPKDGKAITDWRPQDKAYLNITEGIRKVVEELRAGTNPSEGQSSPSRATSHEAKPQFEEKLRVSLKAHMAASSPPPFSTGEPMHLEIDLTIVNIGRDPVFIVAADLKDPTGSKSLGFTDICNENEPLQPGGRRKGKLKLLHHRPFRQIRWHPRTSEELRVHNVDAYKMLRFICQPDSAFHIETALGTHLVYLAVEVCDEYFRGWPRLATPKDILDELSTKTLKDFEDEERAAWEKAGAKFEPPSNEVHRMGLASAREEHTTEKPNLEPRLDSVSYVNVLRHVNEWLFVELKLSFAIVNSGRIASHHWAVVVEEIDGHDSSRSADYRFGRSAFPHGTASRNNIHIDGPILPGLSYSTDLPFGVYLRPAKWDADHIKSEFERMLPPTLSLGFKAVSESSPGLRVTSPLEPVFDRRDTLRRILERV